jgi:hypothetical protein
MYLIILLSLVVVAAGVMMDLSRVKSAAASAASSGGTVWESPQLLSSTAFDGAFIPVMKGDSTSRLLLVYNQVTETEPDHVENPYYRESVDLGLNWSAPRKIYSSDQSLLQVTFAFDTNNEAHAVWRTEEEIWHSSEDEWPNSATRITSASQKVFSPDIAVAPDNSLHVVWSQFDKRIYHAHSEDGGLNWSSSFPLTDGSGGSVEPAIAVDQGGNIHVVWEETIPDPEGLRYEIRHLIGTISGAEVSWTNSAATLSAELLNARRPAIAAQGEVVHVSFANRISDAEQYAYYLHHTEQTGWSPLVNVTQDGPVAMNSSIPFLLVPALALCSDGPSIYVHGSDHSNGKELIIGVNDPDDQLLRDQVNAGDVRAIRPSLVCINDTLHMVFEQVLDPDKNHQIYYLSKTGHALYLPFILKSG